MVKKINYRSYLLKKVMAVKGFEIQGDNYQLTLGKEKIIMLLDYRRKK